MWQVTYAFLFAALTDLVEAVGSGYVGVLDNAWMGLYTAPSGSISPNFTLANITEANYDGYARQKVTWFPVVMSSGGPETVYGQNLFFQPTDSNVANLITGVFLASAAYGGLLYMGAAVGGLPVPLTGPNTALVVKPVFQLPTAQVYGGPDIES